MHRMPKNKLTPFQQVEQNIREADADERSFQDAATPRRVGEKSRSDMNRPERVREAGRTGAAQPGQGPTDDDLSPETLIHEDGALSPMEPGDDVPADRSYRVVGADEAGGAFGLDEAELAHVDPLDGEPWDDDANEDDGEGPDDAEDDEEITHG